jgi:aspartyl-tRNA(Asn)/glutamyl-tRNA(Gln) amidotransferase subunit A
VPDYAASLIEDVKGMTIGVPRHYFFADNPSINRETLSVVETALKTLQELGVRVVEVKIPGLQYAGASQPVIMLSEAFAYHARHLRSKPEEFGDMVRARFRMGALFSRRICPGAARAQRDQATSPTFCSRWTSSPRRPCQSASRI